MNFFIIQSLYIITYITAILAVTLRDGKKTRKQPDIEEFIDRLLTSDKFEKLADKIAEKAADRIITLQETSRIKHKLDDNNSVTENDLPKPRSGASHEIKKDEKQKEDLSDEKSADVNSNKNNTNDSENEKNDVLNAKHEKIDTLAAIQKFSKFPPADLSLNYKHFTTQEKPEFTKATSIATETKSKKHHKKSSHKMKSHKRDNEEKEDFDLTYQRAHLEKRLKYKPNDSDLSIDERKESSEEKKRKNFDKPKKEYKKYQTSKTKRNKKKDLDKMRFESRSSQSVESNLGSNESKFSTTASSVDQTNANKTKDTQNIFKAESNEKTESETNELKVPDFFSEVTPSTKSQTQNEIKSKTTIAFGYADSEKSSQESESTENKVSNIADSAKLDEKLDNKVDVEKDRNVTDIKENENYFEKKTDVKDISKVNIKHKTRELNGKHFAFAEASDYEDYHEKISKILQSVKDKSAKRETINEDLLDFIHK